MTWRLLLFFILLNNAFAEEEEKTRTVFLDEGGVVGTKYWDGDFYEFFGIPYAEVPTGRDRYQAPLPPKPWQGLLAADVKNIVCHQAYFTEDDDEEFVVSGDDGCLLINLYVPEIASEDNLLPVVVYIHSGAFAGGNGHMARFHYLARHDIIVISFNYRLGAVGFACLGNKEIPGNAALKDQVAALRWIKKYVEKFGGDPNKITLAGYSVGASMAELLTLSKATEGIVDQLILDSASALSPFAIDRDPISTAKNLAYAMGYNGTEDLNELTEFYLNATDDILAAKSLNFFLPNSTFGFAPCIENNHDGIEPILTESPFDIMRNGQKTKIPVLIGFANMEGISRTIKFGEWREQMTKDFSNFLPADLRFDNDKTKQTIITDIKKRYFKGDEVNYEKLQDYIDYFSDAMFKYSIIKSLKLRAAVCKRKMYLYEFSYVGKLNMQHNYMDKIKGASHRDQSAYYLDFFGWTNSYKDLDMRDRVSIMWADFVKYGDPTAYESAVVNYKWLPYTNENRNYLQINKKPTMKKNLFADRYKFWDNLYEKYHWNPTAPKPPKTQNIETIQVETNQEKKSNNVNDHKNKATENSNVVHEKSKNGNKEKKVLEEIKKEDKLSQEKSADNKKSVKENIKENDKDKQAPKIENDVKKEDIKINDGKKTKETVKKDINNINQNTLKKQETVQEVKEKQINDQNVKEETYKKDKQLPPKTAEKPKKENKKETDKDKKDKINIVNKVK